MPGFEVWDIVKVQFPYINRPTQQRRPALVVARVASEGAPRFIWVLMITSAAHRRWMGDVEITDLTEAALPAPSIVRPSKIATIEEKDATAAGRLAAVDRPAVTGFLTAALRTVRA